MSTLLAAGKARAAAGGGVTPLKQELFGPTQITTSTEATATAYSNQRKVDRTSNGVLWAGYTYSFSSVYPLFYSLDGGATWNNPGGHPANGSGAITNSYTRNFSFFIDLDDYCHIVFKDNSDGYIYYRRGTPNAGRTAWTWSAAVNVYNAVNNGDVPDVVAHREGTGWVAHVSLGRPVDAVSSVRVMHIPIASDGTVGSLTTDNIASASYGSTTQRYPSIDFHHTGDGKTVKDGTPHLYVAWSAGNIGAGKGIRFRKATYNAGAWTWGTEREINSSYYIDNTSRWLNCLFDGTRVIIGGYLRSAGNYLWLWERDVADTTTTTLLNELPGSGSVPNEKTSGSMSYDGQGNVYLVGRTDALDASLDIFVTKWTRADGSLTTTKVADVTQSVPYISCKRGYAGDAIEFIYTDGSSSPYPVKFAAIGDAPPYAYWEILAAPSNNHGIGPVTAAHDDFIYVIAGSANGNAERYDPATGTWTARAALATLAYGTAHGYNPTTGLIHVIGGYRGWYDSAHDVYDPVANSWVTNKLAYPTGLYGPAFCIDSQGRIYIFGGHTGGSFVAHVRRWLPASNTWEALANIPGGTLAYAHAALRSDNKVYITGGNLNGAVTSTVYLYDIATDTYTTLQAMPAALQSHVSWVDAQDNLYIAAGISGSDTAIVRKYDRVANTWSVVGNVPVESTRYCVAKDSYDRAYIAREQVLYRAAP